jgi:hypothetical protein
MSASVQIFALCPSPSPEELAAVAVAAGLHLHRSVALAAEDLAHELLLARSFPGLSLFVGAPAAPLAEAIEAPLPGPGEWLRRLATERDGPEGCLAALELGRCGDGLLANASPAQAGLALSAVLAPLLPRLLPPPAPMETQALRPGAHAQVSELPGESAPAKPPPGGSGWEAGLLALGGSLDRDRFPPLPEAFERLAPARNVLESAGERGRVLLPNGRSYCAFGFPDLVRPGAKVLLVGEGEPWPEILALHRHPRRVGTCVDGERGLLPGTDRDPDGPAVERTGAPLPGFGTLFALDGSAVYTRREAKVWSWDGRKERDEGSPGQVLASLLLRWSQR